MSLAETIHNHSIITIITMNVQTSKQCEIIVAVDLSGGFAKSGTILPWEDSDIDFSQDLKNFKERTTGHVCIMGRTTYEGILEMRRARSKSEVTELLPGRKSIVLSRNPDFKGEAGVLTAQSMTEAVNLLDADDNETIFVIGGEKIFIQALPYATHVHMSVVNDRFDCDRFFPVDVLTKRFTFNDNEVEKLNDNLITIHYRVTQ